MKSEIEEIQLKARKTLRVIVICCFIIIALIAINR